MNTAQFSELLSNEFFNKSQTKETPSQKLYLEGDGHWKAIMNYSPKQRGTLIEEIACLMLIKNNIKFNYQYRHTNGRDIDFLLNNNIKVELKSSIYNKVSQSRTQLSFQSMKMYDENTYDYFWLLSLPPNNVAIRSWLVPYNFMWDKIQSGDRLKGLTLTKNKAMPEYTLNVQVDNPPAWLEPFEGLGNNMLLMSNLSMDKTDILDMACLN